MHSIKLAIGTADGFSVCDHLARSASFLVFEIEDGRVISETVRSRAKGACGNHQTFVELLEGCRAVICGGICQGAVDSLVAHGIEPLVLAAPSSIQEALNRYLAGALVTTSERVCLCH